MLFSETGLTKMESDFEFVCLRKTTNISNRMNKMV